MRRSRICVVCLGRMVLTQEVWYFFLISEIGVLGLLLVVVLLGGYKTSFTIRFLPGVFIFHFHHRYCSTVLD